MFIVDSSLRNCLSAYCQEKRKHDRKNSLIRPRNKKKKTKEAAD